MRKSSLQRRLIPLLVALCGLALLGDVLVRGASVATLVATVALAAVLLLGVGRRA